MLPSDFPWVMPMRRPLTSITTNLRSIPVPCVKVRIAVNSSPGGVIDQSRTGRPSGLGFARMATPG